MDYKGIPATVARWILVRPFLWRGVLAVSLISIIGFCYYNQSSPLLYSSSILSSSSVLSSSLSSSSSSSSLLSLDHQPHQHVYYLKTHKTGSTTMFFILAEYCLAHGLLPLLPRINMIHINHEPPLKQSQLFLLKDVRKYDMVFNHHIFDPQIFTFLHHDTFAFTILREPFDNFLSAFLYYKNRWGVQYLENIPGTDPVTEYLKNPSKYETGNFRSMTNNRQSVDLGYNVSKGFDNLDYIKSFINQTENQFDLVLITDYFDESLIILKRALRWKTEDILYLAKNKGQYHDPSLQDTEKEKQQRHLHARFSQPDILLYNHFLSKFKQKIENESGLKDEVKEFQNILTQLRDYCESFNDTVSQNLVISSGTWNNGFYVSPHKCRLLKLKEKQITRYLQQRQQTLFQTR